jgi:hypothetical protein
MSPMCLEKGDPERSGPSADTPIKEPKPQAGE